MNAAPHKSGSGFTLIELIIAIVLIGLLATVGTTMISDSFETARVVDAKESFAGRVRYTMERLEREIREGTTVTAASSTGLTFTKGDGSQVIIASNSGGVTVNGATLIDRGPTASLFSYLDETLGTPGTNGDIRFVDINLQMRDDPVNGSGQTISQRSRVALRN